MSRALIITYSIGLQYAVDGTWTQNIYIKRQTCKLEGIVSVVVSMSDLIWLKDLSSGPIHSIL